MTSDLQVTSPQVSVDIDRDKAAALGVTANQIESAFYDAYGPRWVSTIYGSVNEYKVLLELAPEFQQDPSALSMLYFKGGGANSPVVPLDTLATTQAAGRPADREPLRPAAGRHRFVRPRAGRVARRRPEPRARR